MGLARSFLVFLSGAALLGCKGPMGKIESLRDGLAQGSWDAAAHAVDVPACDGAPADAGPCLDAAAKAFGGQQFSAEKPDQASAAAVAYAMARRRRGDGIPNADTWLEASVGARGAGADALRLALSLAMKDAASKLGKKVDDEPAARHMMAAIAGSVPGACATYAALGRGDAVASFAPEASPDHSPCVQHDLVRKEGPGASYGDGVWRGAAGAAALWKDAARALLLGKNMMEGAPKEALAGRLEVIDLATTDLAVKKVETSQSTPYAGAASHAVEAIGDAGVDGGDGRRRAPLPRKGPP